MRPQGLLRLLLLVALIIIVGALLLHLRSLRTPSGPAAPLLTSTPHPASVGCGATGPVSAGNTGTITVGTRRFLLYVPPHYQATTPTPLLFDLAGTGMSPTNQETLTHLSKVAAQRTILLLTPYQRTTTWDVFGSQDLAFFRNMHLFMQQHYCLDAHRIGLAGYSVGASMAYHLACIGTPWLSMIASVAGTMPTWQNGCHPAHALSLLEFHGTADPVVFYQGDLRKLELPIPSILQQWAHAMSCRSGVTAVNHDMQRTTYACPSDTTAALYAFKGSGHTWPGGYPIFWLGKTSTTVDASMLIVDTLLAHPV